MFSARSFFCSHRHYRVIVVPESLTPGTSAALSLFKTYRDSKVKMRMYDLKSPARRETAVH